MFDRYSQYLQVTVGGGTAKLNWRRILIVAPPLLILLGLFLHLRPFAFSEETNTGPLRSIKYPYSADQVESLPSQEWQGKFNKFVHSARAADLIPPFDPSIPVHTLPRLAWVIVATPDAITRYSQELTAISCFCERAGIPFFLEHSVLVSNRQFMTSRHRSVAKHLRYHQWVLATDADVLVANSRGDPLGWLDDAVDVMFNDRDNLEVCACAYWVRNSPGGWSFLRRWMSWDDDGDHRNLDNGDLNELVAAGLRRGKPNNVDYTGRYSGEYDVPTTPSAPGEEPCLNEVGTWDEYHGVFIKCLDRTLHLGRYGDDRKPYWDVTLWEWTDVLPSVRFRAWKVMAGFMRAMDAPYLAGFPLDTIGVYNDFLTSGKDLHHYLGPEALWCTGEEWVYTQEQWSVEEARESMAEREIWWWPGCWDDGVNRCREIARGATEQR